MSDLVSDIKLKLTIEDVVSQYVSLKRSGKHLKGLCPFHNEKTPSFIVNPEKQICWCFGCQKGGDIFNFIQEIERLDFSEAVNLLAQRAHIDVGAYKKVGSFGISPEQKDLKIKLLEMHEKALGFFKKALLDGEQAMNYLLKRGLDRKIIDEFDLGFGGDESGGLYGFLIKEGFEHRDILDSGLVIARDTVGNQVYDRFHGRLIFPIRDSLGRVVAFAGRVLEDGKLPKYMNSPETLIYKKSNVLYGFDKAKNAIRDEGFVVVVEGYMDVIASHMIGVKNVVAVSGTAFTEGQVALIKRFTSNLFLSFDGDAAGVEALKRALVLALPLEMKVKVVCLHEAKDAAELIEKNSDSWRSALGNSRGYLAFLLEFYRNKFTNLEDCNERILDEIFPFMALVKKKTLLDRMIAFLAQELFLKTDSVYEDFNSFQAKNRRSNFIGNQEKITQPIKEHLAAHELLLGMIIAYPELLADFERDLVNCFACFSLGDVYKQILNNYNSSRLEFDRDNFLAQLSDEQRTKINILTLQVEYIYKEFSFDSLKIEASKLFAFLQQNMKRLRRDRLERDLKEAEKAADSEKVNALLLEIQKTY